MGQLLAKILTGQNLSSYHLFPEILGFPNIFVTGCGWSTLLILVHPFSFWFTCFHPVRLYMPHWYPALDCIHVSLDCNLFEVRNCVSGLLLYAAPNAIPGAYYSFSACLLNKCIKSLSIGTMLHITNWKNDEIHSYYRCSCGIEQI